MSGCEPGRNRSMPVPVPEPTKSMSAEGSISRARTKALRSASSTVIPAVSGPYDLGNIDVRTAVQVDEETAQVSAITDPMPHDRQGIPLRTRHIRLNLDRPGFTLNPTNCDPFAVESVLFGKRRRRGTQGSYFQAANCATLKYGPKLTLEAERRRRPPRTPGDPRGPEDQARAKPTHRRSRSPCRRGELLDNSHIDTICTRVNFAAGRLPGRVADRVGDGDDTSTGPAPQRWRLPQGFDPQAARHGAGPEGPSRHRPRCPN